VVQLRLVSTPGSLTYTYSFLCYTYLCGPDAMKRKLTLTVDAELLPVAKQYARSRGVSLSSLVEGALRAMAAGDTQSFASRWRGRLQSAGRDDARYEALARKYL